MKFMCLKLYILMLGFAAGAALAQQTPAEIIDRLGPATRPDVSGNWDRQREAITAAAAELRSLTKTQPGHSTLTAVDALGRTPLMNAAVNGYAEIVDALLTDDAVRAGLETKDRFGASAWALGQFARPLTLFSCHPQMLVAERTALWRPYLQRSGYFLAGSSNSFERIAKSLLAAGARQDANAAKAAWKLECPGHDARIGQSVDATTDLLRALLLDTNERLERFNRTDPSLVPQLRTPPMLAWPDTSDVWEQSWPKPATAACSSKGVSQSIPAKWSGKATFRAVIELQAGVPTVVDIRHKDGRIDRRNQAVLHIAIAKILASYECVGDRVIEHEFDFTIQ